MNISTVFPKVLFFFALSGSALFADWYPLELAVAKKYPEFIRMIEVGGVGDAPLRESNILVPALIEEAKAYYKEDPEIIDRYIKEGLRMREIMAEIQANGPSGNLPFNLLGEYIRFFSRELAYYDPVLSEEKKQQAAQALISALEARPPASTSTSEFIDPTEGYPLDALGCYYELSPWRHRPEVAEYIDSLHPPAVHPRVRKMIDNLLALHHDVKSESRTLFGARPKLGYPFPVHPAAVAQAAVNESPETPSVPVETPSVPVTEAKENTPSPPSAPPSPSPAHDKSPSTWVLLAALAALGGVLFAIMRRR